MIQFEIKTDSNRWAQVQDVRSRDEIIHCRIRICHSLFKHAYLFRGLEALTCQRCDNTAHIIKHIKQNVRNMKILDEN